LTKQRIINIKTIYDQNFTSSLSNDTKNLIFDELKNNWLKNDYNVESDTIIFKVVEPYAKRSTAKNPNGFNVGDGRGVVTYTLNRNGFLSKNYSDKVEQLFDILESPNNTKIIKQGKDFGMHAIVIDLLSGHSCPAAEGCKVKVDNPNQSITIGKRTKIKGKNNRFDCFATKAEVQYWRSFLKRLINTLVVKFASENEIIESIQSTLYRNRHAKKSTLVHFHGSGDFMKVKYFNAAVKIAQDNPLVKFYGYTKILPFALELESYKLDNFSLIYSFGGVYDTKALESNYHIAFVDVEKNIPLGVSYVCETVENDFEFILTRKSLKLHLH